MGSNKGIVWATLQPSCIQELEEYIQLPAGFVPATHFHVTLKFGVTLMEWENAFPGLIGQTVHLWVDKVCYDDKIMAIPVNLTGTGLVSQNAQPHITWGHLPEVKPFLSNAMLEGDHRVAKIPLVKIELLVEFEEWKS